MSADWSDRHASTQHIMPFFAYRHLDPGLMRVTSAMCASLAQDIAGQLPDGPELSAGMRKLLEAKDCFVRHALLVVQRSGNTGQQAGAQVPAIGEVQFHQAYGQRGPE